MHIDVAELTKFPGSYQSERRDTYMGYYLLRKEVEFISCCLKGLNQRGTLLDLCCGSGEISLALDKLGLQILALDVNRQALSAFRYQAQEVPLVQGDALHLPFGNDSLDAIVALHCFDHLDRVGFLDECSRALRCGGLVILDALNRHSYKLPLKRLCHRHSIRSNPDFFNKYVNVFSGKELKQAITGAGFDVQATSGYGWIPFSVHSRSILINAAARIEQGLQLDRLPSVSPRILLAVRKRRLSDEMTGSL